MKSLLLRAHTHRLFTYLMKKDKRTSKIETNFFVISKSKKTGKTKQTNKKDLQEKMRYPVK